MEVRISVKEDKAELFLQILKEFKNDMIEKFQVIDSKYVNDEEQKDIENILNARTPEEKEVASSKIISIDI
ncbi:MAG: hypothetical protein COB42_03325 [Sulfurimonas sp.]|nr:MAG: hypothetical protein COB42_03325 [Sulfurimonas sp.]